MCIRDRLCCSGIDKDDPSYGDLAIATDCPRSGRQLYWYRGGWMDSIVTFWREFSQNAPLSDRQYRQPGKGDTASVTGRLLLSPGEKASVRFILSWNVPNNYNYWNPLKDGQGKDITLSLIHISSEYNGYARRQLVICGSEGTIELKPLEIHCPGEGALLRTTGAATLEADGPDPWRDGSRQWDSGIFDRYDAMMRAFAAYVRGEAENPYSYDYELALFQTILKCCGVTK